MTTQNLSLLAQATATREMDLVHEATTGAQIERAYANVGLETFKAMVLLLCEVNHLGSLPDNWEAGFFIHGCLPDNFFNQPQP